MDTPQKTKRVKYYVRLYKGWQDFNGWGGKGEYTPFISSDLQAMLSGDNKDSFLVAIEADLPCIPATIQEVGSTSTIIG